MNKGPRSTTQIEFDFSMYVNNYQIKRVSTVKYMKIYIDDILNWATHISHQ